MELNSDWPVIPNTTILAALSTGTTLAASSEVTPITSDRPEVVANICLVAGTASAGSPRVSTALQASLWPRTPPAALMAWVAPLQGARSATVMVLPLGALPVPALVPVVPVPVVPVPLELLEQAVSAASAAAASAAVVSTAERWLRSDLFDLRRVVNVFVPSGVIGYLSGYSPALTGLPGRQRHSDRSPASATTRLRMVPMPSMVTSMMSPGFIQTGGVRAKPTPPGVPVAIRSPGLSVVKEEKNSTADGTSTSICEVRADCMTWPLSVVVSARSETSTSSAVTTSGPMGIVASKFLPAVHWVAARCQSRSDASLSTVNPAIASIALSAGI